MANATFTLRPKVSANGRQKWNIALNLEGHKTERSGGYTEKDAYKKGVLLVAEYIKDPEAFFSKSKLKGSGIQPVIEEFLNRPVGDRTQASNEEEMKFIVDLMDLHQIRQLQDTHLAQKFKKRMKDAGRSDGGIRFKLRVLRAFIRFCLDKHYLKEDPWPSRTKQQSGGQPLLPQYRSKGYYYQDDELLKLTTLPENPTDSERDMNLAILLGLYQGWRGYLVWAMNWDRLNLEKGTYNLLGIKGAQDREVRLHAEVLKRLKTLPMKTIGRVITRWGTEDALSQAFTRWRKEVGVAKGRFHDLKHTCISKLFEAGWTMAEVEEYTNTSKGALQFYQHANKKRLGEKLADFSPLPYPKVRLRAVV